MTDVTVWDGSTDDDWTDATNWSNGVPSSSKIASIPASLSTYPDLASDCTVHALELASGATLTGGTNITVYVTGESAGETNAPPDGYAVNLDGAISGELSLNITTPASTFLDIVPSSGNIKNITINHASCVAKWTGNSTLTGNLTINQGTAEADDGDETLTVTGDVIVGDGSGSANTAVLGHADDTAAMTFGSLTIDSDGKYIATSGTTTITKTSATAGHSGQPSAIEVKSGGTFTHNSGTVLLSSSLDQDLEFDGTGNMYNLTINKSDNDVIHNSNLTIEGNLSITLATAHAFRPNTGSRTLTVTGDVTIVEGKLGATTNYTAAISFGSLEIQSGGEYIATSGTTTITTGGTIGGTGDTAFGGEGTFTHNNGTLVLDSVLHRIPKGGTFYNLKLTGSQNTGGIYLYSDTMLPQGIMPDGTTGSAYFSVLGTLEITDDEFRPYNADKVYIHNLVIGDGTGSANSAKFDFAEVDEFDGKVFVDNVTIHSDGQLLFGDGNETSATEGSSALNIYGAFRNLGGSVDIT